VPKKETYLMKVLKKRKLFRELLHSVNFFKLDGKNSLVNYCSKVKYLFNAYCLFKYLSNAEFSFWDSKRTYMFFVSAIFV